MAKERKALQVILTKDGEQQIFNTAPDAAKFIGISAQRVRQLAKGGTPKRSFHKKSGFYITYGEVTKTAATKRAKLEERLTEAQNEGKFTYMEKEFKHHTSGFFVASDGSYINIKPTSEDIIYTAPQFGKRSRIGQQYLYRIVAKLWLDTPEEGQVSVDHIEGLDAGHGVNNIRWATPKENSNGYAGVKKPTRSKYMVDNNEELIFNTQQEVADHLGCKQHWVSKVLSDKYVDTTIYKHTVKRIK